MGTLRSHISTNSGAQTQALISAVLPTGHANLGKLFSLSGLHFLICKVRKIIIFI